MASFGSERLAYTVSDSFLNWILIQLYQQQKIEIFFSSFDGCWVWSWWHQLSSLERWNKFVRNCSVETRILPSILWIRLSRKADCCRVLSRILFFFPCLRSLRITLLLYLQRTGSSKTSHIFLHARQYMTNHWLSQILGHSQKAMTSLIKPVIGDIVQPIGLLYYTKR